jgi:hypothetical protein
MKEVETVGHVARIKEMINANNVLVGNPKRKRPFERPGRRSYKEIVDGAVE